jgi:hypothetical protein
MLRKTTARSSVFGKRCDQRCSGKGTVPNDGRKIHPLYLLEISKPDASTPKWDWLRSSPFPVIRRFAPKAKGNCPPVKEVTGSPAASSKPRGRKSTVGVHRLCCQGN